MERNEHDEVLHDDTAAGERPKARGGEDDELVEAEDEPEEVLPGDFVDEALLEEDAAAPELVRLNKYLADHGVASRRRCDELIQGGQVTVDGATVTELGTKIDPERHKVEIDGFVLAPKKLRKRYYLLNKPGGVVCTNEARELRPRAVDLVTDPRKGRIYTVGRLDEESKGLIILTNDGEFAQRIMHPRHGVEKTYLVRVRGKIDDAAMQKIRNGIHLSEGRTSGARVLVHERQRDSSWLSVTIHEGMNREIRRSFARVGYKVIELKRTRIGPLTDRGLKIGRWRELTRSEIDALVRGAPRVSATEARGKPGPRPPRTFSGKGGIAEAEHRREERARTGGGAPRREARERSGSGAPRPVRFAGARSASSSGGKRPFAGKGARGGKGGAFGGSRRDQDKPRSGRGATGRDKRGTGGFGGKPTGGPPRRSRPGAGKFGGVQRARGAKAPRGGERREGFVARGDRPEKRPDAQRPKSSFPAPMRRPGGPERDDA